MSGSSTLSLAAVTNAEVVTGTSLPSAFVEEMTTGTRKPERVLGDGSTLVTISLVIAAGVLTTVLPRVLVVVTGNGVSTFMVEDATSRVEDNSSELCGVVLAAAVVVVPSLLDAIEDVTPWSLEEDSAPEEEEISAEGEEEPADEESGATVLLGAVVVPALLDPTEDVNPWSLEEDSAPVVEESCAEEPADEESGAMVLLGAVVVPALLVPIEDVNP